MIVGISGFCMDPDGTTRVAGAGKDSAADRLVAEHKFIRIGLADPLKRICQEVYKFTDEQLWGPSYMREAPDKRYPVPGKAHARKAYDEAMEQYAHHHARGDLSLARPCWENACRHAAQGWLTPRLALQLLGTEWGRTLYDNTWIDYGLDVAKKLLLGGYDYSFKQGLSHASMDPPAGVVFSDIRFFNEHAALKETQAKLVRIKRMVRDPFNSSTDNTHQSEVELSTCDDSWFDYVIDNTGTLDMLAVNVDRMMDVFTGRLIPYDEDQKDVPPFLRQ